ncbi:MAG: hypothetical protein PHH54_02950 [Candidatus Nanoarchaeia archaeon]|nr:hypothetical protein [Candidatus Nanoarchaeia archaeon]MDD5740918.1 hypothetical protein [Candidatus Nanoarchaeia archaeon]
MKIFSPHLNFLNIKNFQFLWLKNPKGFLKINKKVLLTFLYDLVGYIIIILGFYFLAIFIRKKIASLTNTVDYSSFFSNNIELINQNFASLKLILFLLLLFIFLFSIFALIIHTLFKGLIWLKLRDKKFSWKFFRKYLLLNLIYLVPLAIILLFVFLQLKSNLLLVIILLIGLHFHVLLSYSLTDENKIRSSFKFAFKQGFKIKYFIIPYLIILTGLFILAYILGSLPFYSLKTLVNFFVFVFYFAISRNYINSILYNIIKEK